MPQHTTRLARACAELILLWHERYGVDSRRPHLDEVGLPRYQERLDRFHRADLSDPAAQRELGREQLSGLFEWAYSETISTALWSQVVRKSEVSNHRPPEHLGEAARWILDNSEFAQLDESPRKDDARLVVEADTRARLLERASDFYADVVAEQRRGLGGLNVLLSCSLERCPWDGAHHRRLTLLRPEVLGLHLATAGERPDDFIDAIRQGELDVESVTGGPAEPPPRAGEDDDLAGDR